MIDISIHNDEIRNSILLHIPHSSTYIPDFNSFCISDNELDNEKLLSTDIATDKIFQVDGIKHITCEFNRLFCDVERFIIGENMDKYGRGLYYTKTINDKNLRTFNYNNYWNILTNYFLPYHDKLTNIVQSILIENGFAIIFDCHSFNAKPLKYEPTTERPEICIGIDDFHTPKYLIDHVMLHFKKYGFNVQINNPYSGTFVPIKFYQNNKNVQSIMIEINKYLYMDDDNILIDKKVNELNRIISELFKFSL
jgi:N-formylglutamate amidohydrolase